MTTVFHTWMDSRFIEIQSNLRRKKLCKTNQGSNFFGRSFSNRDNVRTPIQFRREGKTQHLKRWFFLKNRLIHFHINRTIVIRPVKQNQLSFPSIEINKPNPLSASPTKWSNTLNNWSAVSDELLSVFDHFVGFALKGLSSF